MMLALPGGYVVPSELFYPLLGLIAVLCALGHYLDFRSH